LLVPANFAANRTIVGSVEKLVRHRGPESLTPGASPPPRSLSVFVAWIYRPLEEGCPS
jgi:hypothetical protein